ncbi:Bacterial regulatory proteins, tetR family [Pelagimonas phthalicica]|uniref:Bacterial regulatory proteins, tetR family n=1 Tax=Pelagimonas phthalicica TaxID=1037362 RepID=A0A238J9I9_9RHOB|nr:TetR/AcrR family transcriptional regulator [Pelagimonas phthalicica]TDS94849.1 TetR family transcriptional regulator [Pelagimonas phthalicica]SMX26622.1 Bacterial regulatory proteins, tetR family [Pelagimonas phthalicica]
MQTEAMTKATQARTLKTRARLLEAARQAVEEQGYPGLRTEEVVKRAGTAKGTFFAHFPDKEALLDHLIGEDIDGILEEMEALPAPKTVPDLIESLMPLVTYMAQDRDIFDVIIRRSGAAAIEEIGPIAVTFERQFGIFIHWLSNPAFRQDVSPDLLAEGVQAFLVQAVALNFCALHNTIALPDRLLPYLEAWLIPGPQSS